MKNEIVIHGYLGRAPELQYKNGQNGQYAQATFSVGVSRDFGDETDWFYCIMNGKRAETLEKFFDKGSQILVTGRMRSYKPRNSDQTAWVLDVKDFDFCDRKDSPRGSSNSAARGEPEQTQLDIPDSFEQAESDIPF